MERGRRFGGAAWVVIAAVMAMVLWWGVLGAERSARDASEHAARRTAVTAAVALAEGGNVREVVGVASQAGGVDLAVHDSQGRLVAGGAEGAVVTVDVPGTDLTVSTPIEEAGFGLGRWGRAITLLAVLVLAGSVVAVANLARKRRDAEAEVARMGRRWQQVAAADDLTGLGNRARFLEDTSALVARGGRYGHTFSLVVFDVGHSPTSDVALAAADVIGREAREADLCYRISDGRFVTILPEQDGTGAILAANRVGQALEERTGLRAETGTATFAPTLPCTPADLLLRAEIELSRQAILS